MSDSSKTKKSHRKSSSRERDAKRRQKSLEEARRRYEFIVNTSREFMSLINAKYRYVAANAAYCKALGMDRDEIIDRSVSEIWGEDLFENVIRTHLDRCFAGHEVNYVYPFRFASLGDRVLDVTYYPYRDRAGRVTHAVVVSRDVTAGKKQEEELLFLKKAVETMQLGVTISDAEGKVIYTNPADARMHGYSVDELIGSEVNLFAPAEFRRKRSAKDLSGLSSWTREGYNVRKNNSLFPVQLMSDVVKKSDGMPIGIVTTCEDITARKKAEEQIMTQIRRFGILRRIDTAILSSLDLRVILGTVLDHIVDHLNVHAAAVMTLNPHTLMLEHTINRGFSSKQVNNLSFRLGQGLAGQVALGCRSLHIPNLFEHFDVSDMPAHIREERFCFYFGVPLIVKGQVKGTLEIFHREPISTGEGWVEFMESLTDQTAIAIDNTALFQDLQHSNIEIAEAYDPSASRTLPSAWP
ncbi:MAG: PAS domain S-box protein [Nitrospirae bacterium]|nr:PAS domain S-box protein [Nitrospirota bacterium]